MTRKILKLVAPHIGPSIAVGVAGALYFKDWALTAVALATGWLIDADHLFDFLVGHVRRADGGSFLEQATTGSYFKRTGKVYVLLHSWELAGLWMALWTILGKTNVAVVGGIAWALHLGIDHFTYRLHPLAYFLVYRMRHRFELSKVCR